MPNLRIGGQQVGRAIKKVEAVFDRMSSNFTPTQRAILSVLSDGEPHGRDELVACLSDDLANPNAIHYHLCPLRKILRAKGEDIICEYTKRRAQRYRHVRLLVTQ
jgi:hypothetical protein